MDRAVKIAENTLDMIAAVNGGVKPEIEEYETYFVTPDNDDQHNMIMSERNFRNTFKFVDTELENQFAEVVEL